MNTYIKDMGWKMPCVKSQPKGIRSERGGDQSLLEIGENKMLLNSETLRLDKILDCDIYQSIHKFRISMVSNARLSMSSWTPVRVRI